MYHVCHELGRFPHELPAGLPDEQLVLMYAFLTIRSEEQQASSNGDRLIQQGRAAEAQHQAAEHAAWAKHPSRFGVNP